MTWTQIGPSVTAAFLASLVEFVEALTIVLAVGMVRGWAPTLAGAAGGVAALAAAVAVLGPLLSRIPLDVLQLATGVLLLLFGTRWLRKAILRAVGIIALHDEAAAFARETSRMRGAGPVAAIAIDPVAAATAFKAVVIEGLEVVFIVIAVGAGGRMLAPASLGAAAAGVLVLILGLAMHRPLTRVPENALKFAVGILITAFGAFWIGEGLGFPWPGGDLAIVIMAACLLVAALVMVRLIGGPVERRV